MAKLVGQPFKTLDRGNPFELVAADATRVIVRPQATGKDRPIPTAAIQAALAELTRVGELSLADIRRHAEVNSAYVAALLAALPGVSAARRPITLRWKRDDEGLAPDP